MEIGRLSFKFEGDATNLNRTFTTEERRASVFKRNADKNSRVSITGDASPLQRTIRSASFDVQKFSAAMRRASEVRFRGDATDLSGAAAKAKAVVSSIPDTATVKISERGAISTIAKLLGVRQAAEAADGQDVDVDVDKNGSGSAGLLRLGEGFRSVAGNITAVNRVTGAFKLPFMVAAVGGAIPVVTALGGATLSLASSLGTALVGAAGAAGGAIGLASSALGSYGIAAKFAVTGAVDVAENLADQRLKTDAARVAVREAEKALREATPGTLEYAQAQQQLAQAQQTLSTEQRELNRLMVLNTPAARRFNATLQDAKDRFTILQAEVGNRVLPVLTRFIQTGLQLDSVWEPPLLRLVDNVNRSALSFRDLLVRGENLQKIKAVLNAVADSGGQAFTILSNGSLTALNAIIPLIPYSQRVLTNVTNMSTAARKWSASAEGQRVISDIWQTAIGYGEQLWLVVKNLGLGLANLFTAAMESGGPARMMDALVNLTRQFREFTAVGSEGRARIKEFFAESQPILSSLWNLARVAVNEFFRITDALISAREGSNNLSPLKQVIDDIARSLPPVSNLLITTFRSLGPEMGPLIRNIAQLAETFAGSTGTLKMFVKQINNVLGWFNKLPAPVKNTVAEFVAMNGIVALLGGPSLTGLTGSIVGMIFQWKLFKAVKAAGAIAAVGDAAPKSASKLKTLAAVVGGGLVKGLKAAMLVTRALAIAGMAALLSPVGLVIVGIAALAAGLVIAYKKSETFRNAVNWLAEKIDSVLGITKLWDGGLKGLKDRFTDNQGVSKIWAGGLEGLKKRLTDNKGASGVLSRTLDGLKKSFTDNKGASGLFKNALESLRKKAVDTGRGFKEFKDGVARNFKDAKETAIRRAKELASGVANRFSDLRNNANKRFKEIAETVTSRFKESKDRAWSRASEIRDGVSERFSKMRDNLRNRLREITEAVTNRFKESKDRAWSRASEIRDGVSERFSKMRDNLRNRLREITEAVTNRFGDAKDRALARATEIKDGVTDRFRKMRENASTALDTLRQNAAEIWEKMKAGASGFGDAFRNILTDRIGSAVNRARNIFGALLEGVAWILDKLGADDLAGELRNRAGQLRDPIRFARGGFFEPQQATGGIADGKTPRAVYGEAKKPEAYIVQGRPDNLPYLRTAADWFNMEVVPKYTYKDFARGGLVGVQMFLSGGVIPAGGPSAMWQAVKDKFGIIGFNHHDQYLTGAAATNSIDFMVTTPGTYAQGAQKELGWRIANFVQPPATVNTIYYGQANWGNGWVPYNGTTGIGNAATLGHYDHVHAQAFPDSFKGGQGKTIGGDGGGSFIDWVGKVKRWIADRLPDWPGIGYGIMNDLAWAAFKKMKDAGTSLLLKKAREKMSFGPGSSNGGDSPGGSVDRTTAAGWAAEGLRASGVREATTSNIDKILELAWKESRWNARAVNPVSVGGENASGFMQMLPSTFRANMVPGMDNIFNAVHNIASSARYQVGRYGDLVTFSPYAKGGIIPGIKGMPKIVLAHAGERILPEGAVAAIDRFANAMGRNRGNVSGDINLTISINESKDARNTAAEVEQVVRKILTQIMGDGQQVRTRVAVGVS